jgi:phosphonate transport system substrate-binding protein
MIKKNIGKNIWLLALLYCSLLVSCSSAPETAKDLPKYRIGYMICNSEQETLDRFVPFTRYLSEKLGVTFEPVAIDTINFMQEIESLDFTHTNSLLYIMLQRFSGVEVLAAEKKGSLAHLSQGVIIVKGDSPITSITQLKGKSMIFGPSLAPTGFMSQIDLLQQNGIDPEENLAFYTIPGGSFKHEKVAYGVLFERYDAGALPIDDIETMAAAGRIDIDELRVIGKGQPIPYCNFGVTQKVDEALAKKFKEAVLALTQADTVEIDGEKVRVLKRALVDGFIDIADEDFDVVRELAKRTNMPPYQKY